MDTRPLEPAGMLGAARPAPQTLPVRFSGSGSEYFRIWIVNLLLTLVTLGLYFPWAKVRRLRYFYGNTRIGEHPLAFHGSPSRMLRGFLLVAALLILYSVAGRFSPTAGAIAFLVIAAIWPALFRAGQRFRLANTSWRGLRFRFDGTTAGAYRAMLPLFVPGALLFGMFAAIDAEDGRPARGSEAWFGLLPIALLALVPLFWWMLKKYQHDHMALGVNRTALHTGPGSFYLVFFKALGVSAMVGIAGGLGTAVVGGLGAGLLASLRGPSLAGGLGAATLALIGAVLLVYLAAVAVVRPFISARLQNLVWNATRSADIRFESVLRFRALLWLTMKNWLLIVVTLGFYWPFAAIAMARLRLEAVSVSSAVDPADFESRGRKGADDAAGDAAGDLFGIDIGL